MCESKPSSRVTPQVLLLTVLFFFPASGEFLFTYQRAALLTVILTEELPFSSELLMCYMTFDEDLNEVF